MKLKNSFFYTLRENVKDEESNSGNLLVRSGMIKKTSNGVYMYMPLGFRVLKKIEKIVREEMDQAGAQELLMPALLPEDIYVASGRRDNFGNDMFSLQDRYKRNYVLGPTHEEMFVVAAKEKIRSYKDMPFNLYQIATKYRDETRPRFGLIRVREFIMKDAYSFDLDLEGLDRSYQIMFDSYKRIFDRMEMEYKIVRASTGAMGGLLSEEFQAVTKIGEDVLVLCDTCDYASNLEVSECVPDLKETREALLEKELVSTPNVGTIEEVSQFLGLDPSKFVKTLIYQASDQYYACLIRGDREINEAKIATLLGVKEVTLASPEEVERITHAKVGFAGPIGLDIPIIMDQDIKVLHNYIVGANRTDYHYINVNNRDFEVFKIADIKNVKEGDHCPKCGGILHFARGIEVGNTFKLGNKYSKALDLRYLDQNNQLQYVEMGCYGIGLGRIMAAVAEQKADQKGIAWPIALAPYQVGIILINTKEEEPVKLANRLYEELEKMGIEVLLDDREERPGVKFNDMDLIGIPVRITVGKKASEGIVEYKLRSSDEVLEYTVSDLLSHLKDFLS